MGLTLVTAPVAEPVSVAEAATHLRLDASNLDDDTDTYVASLIQAAREHAEMFTRKRFVTQTWALTLDEFPFATAAPWRMPMLEVQSGLRPSIDHPIAQQWIRMRGIELPNPPLQSITSLTYVDVQGQTQTLAADGYLVDTTGERGFIAPAFGTSWPATYPVPNALRVVFVCGFGPASQVPATIAHAIKMLVAHWYSQRELFVTKRFALEVPMAVDALLWGNRALEAA